MLDKASQKVILYRQNLTLRSFAMFIFSINSLKVRSSFFKSERHLNVQCPMHIHYSMELVFVSRGELIMNVSGRDRLLTAGTATLMFPFEQHSFHTPKSSSCLVIEFSPEMVSDFYDRIKDKQLLSEVFKIDEEVMNFCDNNLPDDFEDSIGCRAVLYPLCEEILKRCEFDATGKAPDKTFIEAVKYIQQNFTSEAVTLTETAKALGIHSVYLSRLFTKESGMSFTKYVNLMRCTHAAERIRNERDLNLSQIAYESGFGSIRSFNRAFIECFGLTPKQYRQK